MAMEYYNGKLCVSMRELVGNGIMTESNYRQLAHRGAIEVVRKGGRGTYSLASVESLPDRFRDLVTLKIGKAELAPVLDWLSANYKRDQDAVLWVNGPINTKVILSDSQKEALIVNASVLNSCILLLSRAIDFHRVLGCTYQWEKMAEAVKNLRVRYGHTLPTSMFHFREKVARYKKEGYASLVSGKFGNTNALKHSKD